MTSRRVTPLGSGLVGLALIVTLTSSACDLEPDVGAPFAERCANTDSAPSTPVSFARDVQPILARICSTCHYPGGENAIGLQLGGLDLSSYDTLKQGGAHSSGVLVQPTLPCESILYQKVSPGPPFGSRMPLNGPPVLSSDELGVIHDWIAEGAKKN